MGAVFVSASANAPATATFTNVVGAPGALTAGNILLAFCGWYSGNGYRPNPVTSPGWTFVDDVGIDDSAHFNSTLGMTLLTKTVTGSEPGTYTFTYPTVPAITGTSVMIVQYTAATIDGFGDDAVVWVPAGYDMWATASLTAGDPTDTVVLGLVGVGLSDTTTASTIPAGYSFEYRNGLGGAAGSIVWVFDGPAGGTTVAPTSGTWIGSRGFYTDYLVALKGTGTPPANPTTFALGPVTVEVGSGGSSGAPPIITSGTITGTARLDAGPVTVIAADFLIVDQGRTVLHVGPVTLAALGGRIGPGAWPVPGFRGRWRLTLHKRPFTPATLASTIIAELADARGRRLEQAWNTPAMLTFTLDGHSQSAALIEELVHDVVAWRWDDQTGQEFAVFRGTITQSEDQITTENHVVTYTCHDYAATLTRRLLTATYTVTARDQDLIAGDLLSRATAVSMSSGTSLSPACFLPISLLACNPDGSLRGLSGQNRDRTYYGSQNIGTALDDLAKITNGFDYDVAPSAVDDHDSLRVFYPQQGVTRTGDIALQYGSTVATLTRSVNSADYANYVRVLGNNQSANPTPQFYGEAAAAGAPTTPAGIWMLADDAADVTVSSALGEKAVGDIALNAILVPHYTLGLAPGAYTWGNPNMGDTVPLIIQSGRLDVNTTVRVLGIAYDIGDDGQEDVALTVNRPATRFSDFFNRSAQDIRSLARR